MTKDYHHVGNSTIVGMETYSFIIGALQFFILHFHLCHQATPIRKRADESQLSRT